jgi:hypothetical protein
MRLAVAFAAVMAVGGVAMPAFSEEDAVIGEVLGILLERGLVDEEKYTELVTKNARYEAQQASLLGRIELSGDLRGAWRTSGTIATASETSATTVTGAATASDSRARPPSTIT